MKMIRAALRAIPSRCKAKAQDSSLGRTAIFTPTIHVVEGAEAST